MKEFDVAVIGGGPIGGHVAKEIAKKNYTTAIFEKDREIGKPVNCAGLVTPRVFDNLQISENNIIQNKIKGANIHSPSGDILKIGGDKIHAYVINRELFDKKIVENSVINGADIFLESNIISIKQDANKIKLRTSKNKTYNCSLLIGADGPSSKVRKSFNFPEPKEILNGVGAEIKNTNLDPNFVEIFIGNKIAPGFFAWVIPTNREGNEARIGLCAEQKSPNPPIHYLFSLLKNKKNTPIFKDIKIISKSGGIVPLGALKKTYGSNVLLVGDAAAQVKPTSGGGIYTGLKCATYCSNIAIKALELKDISSKFLSNYQKKWTAEIGKELKTGMKLRSIYRTLKDEQFNKYIKLFNKPEITDIISKYGDIDYPSKLIKPLLKKTPSLLKLLPNLLKN
jgi:geranylgeranyl reductase family protein